MRIGLGMHPLNAKGTGIHTYGRNLLHGLPGQGVKADLDAQERREWRIMGRGVGGVISMAANKLHQPKVDCDLFHATDGVFYRRGTKVLTIHDLIWMEEPQSYAESWATYRAILPFVKRRGVHVVTPSQYVADKVVGLGVKPENTTVVPLGVDHEKFYPDPGEDLDRTLLVVGDNYPRKRLDAVLQAARTTDYRIIRVGPPLDATPYGALMKEWADRTPGLLEDRGYVDSDELRRLYSRVSALVYPSGSEGFGLPPLEAAACGTPSIVADLSLYDETLGPDAVRFPVGGRLEAAVMAVEAGRVPSRADLIARAGRFQWSETAKRHADLYRTILEARS